MLFDCHATGSDGFCFSFLNRPNQEAALLLKCKFSWLKANATVAAQWTAVSLHSLKEVGDKRAAHNASPAFLCVADVCVVVLIRAAVHFGSVSQTWKWFRGSQSDIDSAAAAAAAPEAFFYLLIRQMRGLRGGAERGVVAEAAAVAGDGDDDGGRSFARLLSASSRSAIS